MKYLTTLTISLWCGSAFASPPLHPEKSAQLAGNSVLMIPNSSDDTVALFDTVDGSMIDRNFIDAERIGLLTSVFIEAQRVGDEIWVTDSLEDVVFRFSINGRESVGVISDLLLNNPEGFEIVGDTMLVASRDGIISIDVPNAMYLGVFEYRSGDSSINDVFSVAGTLLVSNSDTDNIDVISSDGSYLSTLIDSDGVNGFNFPQQINESSEGELLIASFATPAGVYRFNADGSGSGPVFAAENAVRGVHELGNGNLIFTNNDGVFVLEVGTGVVEMVAAGRSGFISVLNAPPCVADFTGDGALDFFDVSDFLSSFGAQDLFADLTDDGVLDFFDISAFLNSFAMGCP